MQRFHQHSIKSSSTEFLKSKVYWILTGFMIICSGIGVSLLTCNEDIDYPLIFVLGASFPTLFKKLIANTTGTSGKLELGDDNSVFNKYFTTN